MSNTTGALREAQGVRLHTESTRTSVSEESIEAIEAAEDQGLIASARMHAGGYVTHVALMQLQILSIEEQGVISSLAPNELNARVNAELRCGLIVDTFVGLAGSIIGGMR